VATAPHILVIEARFYDHIADALLAGAQAVLKQAGATFDVLTVPGILEIPATAMFGLSTGTDPAPGCRYDGFVALGCAIKGETDHYEHVCREAMAGVTRVALDLKAPAGNGILTCPTEELAVDRSDPARGDAGGRAARACLRLIEVKRGFGL
jgi:6,7-dimethyl-8-ribityllumazine synthase